MEINIIHLRYHTERVDNSVNLCMLLGGGKIVPAVVPLWETEQSPRSVRGCALSHLNCLLNIKNNEPLLVLEDDAAPRPDIWDEVWNKILTSSIPEDCGVLIVGSELCENYIPSDTFFVKIMAPIFGSHAVIYNTKILNERNFLTYAYQILASNQMGDTDLHKGICYESVMMQALERCGLAAYRPKNLPFTTIENTSTRDGVILTPNTSSLDIP